MNRRIPIYILAAGFSAQQIQEGEHLVAGLERDLLKGQPVAALRLFGLLTHGGDPEQPNWPLRTQEVVAASTASASTSFAVSPLRWPGSS